MRHLMLFVTAFAGDSCHDSEAFCADLQAYVLHSSGPAASGKRFRHWRMRRCNARLCVTEVVRSSCYSSKGGHHASAAMGSDSVDVERLHFMIGDFAPLNVRVNLYDATSDTNRFVRIDDEKEVAELWEFVLRHARNPVAALQVPAAGAVLFDFRDANNVRHVVDYDSHGNFTIDDRIRGELTNRQSSELWARERLLRQTQSKNEDEREQKVK
jgi:hypothetical protein